MLRAVRETKTIEKVVYTSSFFALGPTDGSVADETQVHYKFWIWLQLLLSEIEKD